MPNKADIVRMAFSRANGANGVGDPVSGEDYDFAARVLGALVAELVVAHRITLGFDLDNTPDRYLLPLADLLSHEIAGQYEVTPQGSKTGALMRLRAVHNPYVRDMDLNDNGATSEGEITAFDRGAYF
ncbi:hypothetical protein CNY89_00020 [Amaricoccus sp. HAR-UPW-R2A-40]|nr:hypothetical protein CNY89_00020 [Amaricoccus sp. HAR-UPW-R2A-40]